jgi:DNA-directed RNA polymerase specialized sigma24 family protein
VFQASPSTAPSPVTGAHALLDGVLRADATAFRAFFETWFPLVYGYVAPRVTDATEAERLTERALSEVLERLPGYTGKVEFSAWVLAIVRRELARVRP